MNEQIGRILWSIALPGFGQFLNGKYVKGLLLTGLEFLINLQAHLNTAIQLSFYGEMHLAVEQTDLQWLLFYPCIYLFGIWDAYLDAGGGKAPYSYLPFVLGAYAGTVGVIFSPKLTVLGILLGPVWLPILAIFIGVAVGLFLKTWIVKESDLQPTKHF